MSTEPNDKLNYTLFKFSKFISDEMIDNGQFIVIKKYNDEDGTNRETYYIYPILEVLKNEKDKKTVEEDVENLMKSKKCPDSSIGYSTYFFHENTEEQEKWTKKMVNYKGKPYKEVKNLFTAYGFST